MRMSPVVFAYCDAIGCATNTKFRARLVGSSNARRALTRMPPGSPDCGSSARSSDRADDGGGGAPAAAGRARGRARLRVTVLP